MNTETEEKKKKCEVQDTTLKTLGLRGYFKANRLRNDTTKKANKKKTKLDDESAQKHKKETKESNTSRQAHKNHS